MSLASPRPPPDAPPPQEYAIGKYGSHPALYRKARTGSSLELPVFYIYDSYHTPVEEWKQLLGGGSNSIRGSPIDAFVLFLLVEKAHQSYATVGGFDGL